MKNITVLCLCTSLCAAGLIAAFADERVLAAHDLRIEQRGDGGYHVFIRAKQGIASVLLAETTVDPKGKSDNYTYRAETWNSVNGDEKRLLNGKFLAVGLYSLIDSTPETDISFGQAFHIFIPWVVLYGYPWSRNGKVFIADGMFVNVRAFEKPYGDYTGRYADNPYKISVTQRPFERPNPAEPPAVQLSPPQLPSEPAVRKPVPDTSLYMPETVRSFEAIAADTGGKVLYSSGEKDIVPVVASVLDGISVDELDLIICLDTTASMLDDIQAVQNSLPAMIAEKIKRFSSFRLGIVLYKDYFEDYVVKAIPFTSDVDMFTRAVSGVRVQGGRDIPEAVYEALHEALTAFPWSAKAKHIILIGDAPAHPLPRGKITRGTVEQKARTAGVSVDVIILPH